MAKKSKKPKATRKKTTSRRPRKSPPAKAKSKSQAKATKPVKPRSTGGSVDLLLKKFAKDRIQQETQLSVLRKKRGELEAKSSKLQEQISKLRQQEKEIESQIGGLDRQRDQAVKELLAKLGIKLDGYTPPSSAPGISNPERTKHQRDVSSSGDGRNN